MGTISISIPINVHVVRSGDDDPLVEEKALAKIRHFNKVNKAPTAHRIHSLVVHPTAIKTNSPSIEKTREFSQCLFEFLNSNNQNPITSDYLQQILQDPSWWPIAYNELFERGSKQAFDRFGKLITPIMDENFASYSIPDFVSKVLEYAFTSNYTFLIAMQMLNTAIALRFPETPVTILWDDQRVRVLYGVDNGVELVETYLLAWDYIEHIWPSETSTLVSYHSLLANTNVGYINFDELSSFIYSKWNVLTSDTYWIDDIPAFSCIGLDQFIGHIGITKVEVLGPSFVCLMDSEESLQGVSLIITKICTANRHSTGFIGRPDLWLFPDSIATSLVDAFIICLILDLIENRIHMDDEGVIDLSSKVFIDGHIADFERKFVNLEQKNGARC